MTLVALEGLVPTVHDHVFVQPRLKDKTFVADVALERLFSGVGLLVRRKSGALRKGRVAHLADVRLFSRVDSFVIFHTLARRKRLAANTTRVRFFPRVLTHVPGEV